MIRNALAATLLLVATSASAEPRVPPASGHLGALFDTLKGQHVVLASRDGNLEASLDTVAADHFCARSRKHTLCVPFASVDYVELVKPGADRIVVRVSLPRE